MADTDTRVPAPPEAIAEYEQLAADVALFERRHVDRIVRAWYASTSRGARRRYDDAVRRAEHLAVARGRVIPVDDQGGGAIVAGAAAAYARLDDLLIVGPSGTGIPVLVDVAYAILTADLLDGADVETITSRWAGVLEGPETQRQPEPARPQAPAPRAPVDAAVDVALVDPAGEPADDEPEVAHPARRRRRLRRRGALAFAAAVASLGLAGFLLGLANAGTGIPAGLAGLAAVVTVILTFYGMVANRAAGRLRRQ